MNHTPAPWLYDEPAIYSEAYGAIAETMWDPNTEIDPDAQTANGRLIAAAPDLLAACEVMVRRCRGRMADPRYPAWHDGCCDEARDAIAKARGEAAP